MSIIEQRVLKSVEFLVDSGYVQICWEDQIVKDGFLMHSSVHRGAYPVDSNGDVDDSIDISLNNFLGDIGAAAQKKYQNEIIVNADLRQQIDVLKSVISEDAEIKLGLFEEIRLLQLQISALQPSNNNEDQSDVNE